MGIEKNKDGAYLPDKQTNWTDLSQEERSEVYGSLKEKYGGSMARLDLKKELEEKGIKEDVEKDLGETVDDFWENVWRFEYDIKFKANDPELKGMPVSMTLKKLFQREFGSAYGESSGMKDKENEMMFFCLDYLQNGEENISANPSKNIDTVPMDGSVEVYGDPESNRWKLRTKDKDGNIIFDGFIFPDEY